MAKRVRRGKLEPLEKCPTGISGLDEITEGGLPRGRPTLVCGSAGSGKTLLGMEFLIRGITSFNEPGVFMAFEESAQELAENVASLGFDVPGLIARKKLLIDHVRIERSEIEETGEYDLEMPGRIKEIAEIWPVVEELSNDIHVSIGSRSRISDEIVWEELEPYTDQEVMGTRSYGVYLSFRVEADGLDDFFRLSEICGYARAGGRR